MATRTRYATKQDIIDRYGDDILVRMAYTRNEEVIDDLAVTNALGDRADEIDTYLTAVAELPLDPVPPIVEQLNVDMAIYQLAGDAVTEQQQKRYDNAVKLLTKISEGKIKLGLPAADQPESSDAMHVSAQDKLFDRTKLDQY